MNGILKRLGRYPTYISNGLIVHAALNFLRSAGVVIEPYLFYQEGPFGGVPPRDAAAPAGFEFVECGPGDVDELASFYRSTPGAPELLGRFEHGHRCYALKKDGRVAAFSWCETKEIGFQPCARTLGENEAYLYGAETRFEFRGHRLQPALRYMCYEALRADGRTLLYSFSDYFNYPARRFKEKLGARVLFTGLSLDLFGKIRKKWVLRRYAVAVEPADTGQVAE